MTAKRPRLVLGSAQLGLRYGVANATGLPAEADAIALIRAAAAAGVTTIDTARAYGAAESRIGRALADAPGVTVVTKLDPLGGLPETASPVEAVAAAEASLAASREALESRCLGAVLLHRAEHRTLWQGAIWRRLRDERAAGRIGRLGVSVQTPAEAFAALADPGVEHIQMPFNILDRRWDRAGVPAAARARPALVVHVRSVYLQGLLARPDTPWPKIAGIDAAETRRMLSELAPGCGRDSVADLALAYARSQDWIDGIVIGMESRAQLDANLTLFAGPLLTADACARIHDAIPDLPDTLLDPARWPHPEPAP